MTSPSPVDQLVAGINAGLFDAHLTTLLVTVHKRQESIAPPPPAPPADAGMTDRYSRTREDFPLRTRVRVWRDAPIGPQYILGLRAEVVRWRDKHVVIKFDDEQYTGKYARSGNKIIMPVKYLDYL